MSAHHSFVVGTALRLLLRVNVLRLTSHHWVVRVMRIVTSSATSLSIIHISSEAVRATSIVEIVISSSVLHTASSCSLATSASPASIAAPTASFNLVANIPLD